MSLVTVLVMVQTSDSEVWESVNIKFQPQAFIDAPNKYKFICNLASKSILGSSIRDMDYKYSLEDAQRDLKEAKKVINKTSKNKK